MDWDFCFLDDNFFESEAAAERPSDISYTPKHLQTNWFTDNAEPGEDYFERMKCQADFKYLCKDPWGSLQIYVGILDKVAKNSALHRDIAEGITRCHFALGQYDIAVSQSQELIRSSPTFERQLGSLILLVDCYRETNETLKEITVLHRLIHVHPMCEKFWTKLGSAYGKLLDPLPATVKETREDPIFCGWESYGQFWEGLSVTERRLVSCACFVRSRMLSKLEPKCGNLSTVDNVVDRVTVSERFLETAQQMLWHEASKDHSEDGNNSNTDFDSNLEPANRGLAFHAKWFSWISSYLENSQDGIPAK